MNLRLLRQLGFDESSHVPFTKLFRVRCSQCEALCINGVPTHEAGCPHTPVACRECGTLHPDREAAAQCCAEVM